MKAPKPPANEAQRIEALRDYRILDTPPEAGFDGITKLAAHLLDVPIALVSFVDSERQWFKSRYGLDAPQAPRDISLCGHVVEQGKALVIADARTDERFADNPLVVGGPKFCFYAGMPLVTKDGHVLGTLCVIDTKPKVLDAAERGALEILSAQVMAQLDLRRRNLELLNEQKVLQELQRNARNSTKNQDVLQQVMHLRLRRSLQLSVALIEMQIATLPAGETRAALKGCVGRLHALAAAHLLGGANYSTVPLADYVRRVARDVFDAFQPTPGQVSFECDAEDMELPMETAIPCGLLLNELIANASMHAFPNGRRGTIRVEVRRVGMDDLRVCVKDDGVGLPEGFDARTAQSIGMRMLVVLADRLGASIETSNASGTAFALTFPWKAA